MNTSPDLREIIAVRLSADLFGFGSNLQHVRAVVITEPPADMRMDALDVEESFPCSLSRTLRQT